MSLFVSLLLLVLIDAGDDTIGNALKFLAFNSAISVAVAVVTKGIYVAL